MNAIIADDDELSLEILRNVLEEMGYGVEAARNGREVMDLLASSSTHLVITDWQMPELNGLELCQQIRQRDFNGYVYVILVTAQDSPDRKIEGLQAGADAFLAKPLNPAELLVCLRTAERILSLETRDLAIFALAKLAESRDPDTGAHLERVQNYSRILAQHLALNPKYQGVVDAEFVRLIFQTSPLHDIGKVGIPDSILLKPGKLEPSEFEIMKTHTELGAQTLSASLERFPNAKFLQMARDIALTHHEKYDGSGYPRGLMSDQIPLAGRIVAVADVYDALTSRRVYKKAYSPAQARTTLVEGRGRHFDPALIDAFLACEDQFMAICRRLQNHMIDLPMPAQSPNVAVANTSEAILVADDDPQQLEFVRTLLQELNCPVLTARDGEEAFRIIAQHRPRLVLSDWVMPRMDGLALCRQIRASTELPYIYFVLSTIHADRKEIHEAFEAGVDDFIAKPIRDAELAARLRAGKRALALRDDLILKHQQSTALNTQLSGLNNRLETLAITDDLTGLFNRRHAMLRVEESWIAADRYRRPLSLMVVDVDHFKKINDTYGHSAGDMILRQIAMMLRQSVRTTDTVCRTGGDEFLVICPSETTQEAALCAERCRATVADFPFEIGGKILPITVSIGLASKRPEMQAISELLHEADTALYQVKYAKRNGVSVARESAAPRI